MLIPIGTDSPVKRTPVANITLVAVNIIVYLIFNMFGGEQPSGLAGFEEKLALHAYAPKLYEFFTYQFVHASILHIAGNLIFLAVFGNSVNGKMGNIPYLLFYLAGGVFAGAIFSIGRTSPLVGASGSIAAVTTAYLVLFPRSYITFIYWFFFIGKIELPGMIIIVFKIVLWDNIIQPGLSSGGNVAYSAHLAGYAFGFVAVMIMLMVRAIPRDHFDLLALAKRWYQRRTFAAAMSRPEAKAQAQFGRMARPISAQDVEAAVSEHLNEVTELRMKIAECLRKQDRTAAADFYERLMAIDPDQVLSSQQQIDVANQLYHLKRTPQAAAAYEKYLRNCGRGREAHQVQLLLGIIYARDLQQYETAKKHLSESRESLTDSKRREQCDYWLQTVMGALGQSGAGA